MASQTKQWLLVGLIAAGLGVGAMALARAGATMEGVEVGRRAPDFTAVDLASGDSVSLRDRYDGQVTLVNIWATWCVPCRAEMPAIEALYRDLAPQGFRVAAVSIDDGNPQPVRAFGKELGLTFDLLHDPTGRIEQVYQTTGVPESFLIDRNGVIVRKIIGEHPWNSPANRRIVEQLLAGESVPAPRLGTDPMDMAPPTVSDQERSPPPVPLPYSPGA